MPTQTEKLVLCPSSAGSGATLMKSKPAMGGNALSLASITSAA